jgi:hypothetical protein
MSRRRAGHGETDLLNRDNTVDRCERDCAVGGSAFGSMRVAAS